MKNDAESKKLVEVSSIVQLTMADDRGFKGCLLVVTHVETWGVRGWIRSPGYQSNPMVLGPTWNDFEPTGGRALFGMDGERLNDGPKQRHHA